jgi:hypothetical protein
MKENATLIPGQSLLKNKLHFVTQLSMLRHWQRLGKLCYFNVLNNFMNFQKV